MGTNLPKAGKYNTPTPGFYNETDTAVGSNEMLNNRDCG